MKSIFRNYSRLITMLFLACLTALVVLIPGGQSIYAQQGKTRQPDAPVGTGFTYQGQLKDGGNPATGQYDLQFKLFDAASGGTQVGSTVSVANQTVTGGLFTAVLDFGTSAFGGQARWLEIAVRPAGGGNYTVLSPRQPLTAVPYAQSLATGSTGAVITATIGGSALSVINMGSGNGLFGESASYAGIYGRSTFVGVLGEDTSGGDGVRGQSATGIAVRGSGGSKHGGLFTNNSTTGYAALQGIASGTPGYGVYGEGNSIGIWGSTTNGTGVRGATTGGYGVHGYSTGSGTGVRGESPGGSGVYGLSTSGRGVYGHSTSSNGVRGESDTDTGVAGLGSIGVEGVGTSGSGVYGYSSSASGVHGQTAINNSWGVWGEGSEGGGVAGMSTSNTGVYGTSNTGWAGWFDGNVNVNGSCCAAAEGTFKIDHPLDPEGKYLVQSAVQSADMISVYSGNATTDAKGETVVTLPAYVEALNKDFRYQLTIMGEQFAQARISSKIENSRFTIKTDKPNIEVSWQVTGVRQDPYAKAHPIVPEVDKAADEQGLYRHPLEYGQPESKGTEYEKIQQMKTSPQEIPSNPTAPGR